MRSSKRGIALAGSGELRRTVLPSITFFDSGVGVSGSNGFIGSHLAAALGAGSSGRTYPVDACDAEALRRIAESERIETWVHLAAAGTVLAGLESIPRMVDVSVRGLLAPIEVFRPSRVVYASSCSVYGNTPPEGARPESTGLNPLSVYGLSKALSEKTLEQWVRQTGSDAVILRIGNVIGAGCKGLIAYLVRHGIRYPDGSVPAQMRGGGQIVRDYVPVSYVVDVARRVLGDPPRSPGLSFHNVGSGCALSNGEVADVVTQYLATQGYRLRIRYEPDPDLAEAAVCRLHTADTENALDLEPPTERQVRDAIVSSARFLLADLKNADGCLEGSTLPAHRA